MTQVKQSIASTIGVEYELLVWDNKHEKKGLCEVYNLLAGQAKYEYLCFLHEDILFDTKNWGALVCRTFAENQNVGIIGVAGSKYKSSYFSGWYTGLKEFDCANIVHRLPGKTQVIQLKPREDKLFSEVVCVDGVFICCRKEIWATIKFDENNLTGFHFYDIDFSLRASLICSVYVTYEISIIHITKGGDFGNDWVDICISYHELKKDILPVGVRNNASFQGNLQEKLNQFENFDLMIAKTWLDVLKRYNVSWKLKIKWISRQGLLSKPLFLPAILKFLLYKPLGLQFVHKLVKTK